MGGGKEEKKKKGAARDYLNGRKRGIEHRINTSPSFLRTSENLPGGRGGKAFTFFSLLLSAFSSGKHHPHHLFVHTYPPSGETGAGEEEEEERSQQRKRKKEENSRPVMSDEDGELEAKKKVVSFFFFFLPPPTTFAPPPENARDKCVFVLLSLSLGRRMREDVLAAFHPQKANAEHTMKEVFS